VIPEQTPKVIEWSRLRLEAASKLGIDQTIPRQLPKMLREVGFVEVQTQDHKWPIGPWMEDEKMKEIGNIFLEMCQLGKMDYSKELLAHLGMGEQEITDLVEQVGAELGIGKIYNPVQILWARKPK